MGCQTLDIVTVDSIEETHETIIVSKRFGKSIYAISLKTIKYVVIN